MEKKLGFYFALFLLAFMAFGCAAPRMYYWGDYSNSLYACCKDQTEENLIKHKIILENIIEESHKRELRVPPGVYAELGYIHFRQNKNAEAIKFFDLEEKTYPESKVFMQRLTQAAKAKDDSPKKEGDRAEKQ